MADAGTWDEAKLMGIGEEGKGAEAAKADPLYWGVPGYLTKEEAEAYVSTRVVVLSLTLNLLLAAEFLTLFYACKIL